MAILRTEEQHYSTVADLQAETIVPALNDVVFLRDLWRAFRWKAGDTTAEDGQYVVNQVSETLNGRWVAATVSTAYTGTASSDAIPVGQVSEFTVTVTGVSLATPTLLAVTNANTLVAAGLSIEALYVSADNTVTVRLKNDSSAAVASQTVNVTALEF